MSTPTIAITTPRERRYLERLERKKQLEHKGKGQPNATVYEEKTEAQAEKKAEPTTATTATTAITTANPTLWFVFLHSKNKNEAARIPQVAAVLYSGVVRLSFGPWITFAFLRFAEHDVSRVINGYVILKRVWN